MVTFDAGTHLVPAHTPAKLNNKDTPIEVVLATSIEKDVEEVLGQFKALALLGGGHNVVPAASRE